jgi:predicted RNA-binding Zn-ribbon protein involved in translation (DUF1610 family)
MNDWIQKYADARCGTKKAFRKASKADSAAMKASLRTGELIVSYQCCDCGRWHIGHAEEAQVLARRTPVDPLCIICGKPISKSRRRRAGASTQVCSSQCAKRKRRRAYQQRKKKKEQLESDSDGSQ